MEKLIFQDEHGEDSAFYVLEQTRLSGRNYLLVTDAPKGDGECLILKDTAAEGDTESLYEIVEDERELSAVLPVFEQLLEDVDIQRE